MDAEPVKQFMRSVAPVELELILAASFMSERSGNFHRLAEDAGLGAGTAKPRAHRLELLEL